MSTRFLSRRAVLLGATTLGLLISANANAKPWTFGLMSDTQWIHDTGTDDASNPGTVPVTIIDQINKKFVNAGVSFVIQDGDLVDKFSASNEGVRAAHAQALYDAGIGFFPLRGNHDSPDNGKAALTTVQGLYPQMTGAGNTFGAKNFVVNPDGTGSYAFDYGNTRFVMLDQFTGASASGTNIDTQLAWLSNTLSTTTNPDPGVTNSFVLGHKDLIGAQHVDTLFGANPASNPTVQNQFYSILAQNNVDAYIGGHDHVMQVDKVTSMDGKNIVNQIISGSDSNKFYVPAGTPPNTPYVPSDATNAEHYNRTGDVDIVAQSLYGIGYWIFTVNAADVYASYYEASPGSLTLPKASEYLMAATPTDLNFNKLYTFKFENGKMVPEPSTWAMMLAGFAGLAFAGVRARKRIAVAA